MTRSRSIRNAASGLALVGLALGTLCCAGPERRLSRAELPLPGADRGLAYALYLPPDFSPDEGLPLVVFLHGGGDGPDCFDEARVGQRLDAGISAGRLPRVVIAVPEGDLGFWENWADGSYRYRDWVVRGLMPDLAARYGTAPCPEGCHLVGISMGGHGALRFLLFEPGLFATVTAISAPIVDTDAAWHLANESWLRFVIPTERIWGPGDRESIAREDYSLRWTRPEDLGGTRLMLAWGQDDRESIVETNERFDRHLRETGIAHEVLVFEGGHDWDSWTPALERVLITQIGAPADAAPAPARSAVQTK